MARKLAWNAALATVLAALALPAAAGAATRFAAVTDAGRAVTFDSDSPGAIRSAARVTGLSDDEEKLAAIALRLPQGTVYGLGTANRLYVVDPRGGAARPVTAGLIDFNLRGFHVGFDPAPGTGELRVVNDADQNFRLDPYTGTAIDHQPSTAVLDPDIDLQYPKGDPGAGENPNVSAIAYAPSGALYGIDSARDTLVIISPPDEGVVNTVGRLGLDADDPVGFEITDEGDAWATFRRAGRSETGLYRISLGRGRAARARRDNAVGSVLRGRLDPVRSMVVLGELPGDRRKPRFSVAARVSPPVNSLLRGRPLQLSVACDEACSLRVRLELGRRAVGTATSRIRDVGGRRRLNLALSRSGRQIVRRAKGGRLRLTAVATDAAGNRATFPRGRRR